MLINIASAASYFAMVRQAEKMRVPQVPVEGNALTISSGVDVQGRRWKSRDAPCRVVRITDDDCPYCQQDAPKYSALINVARAAGCEVLEVAPKAGQMAENLRDGVVQLKYIDADLGPHMFPFVTPQTLIVDRSWVVRWSQRGILDDGSLAASAAAVRYIENEL